MSDIEAEDIQPAPTGVAAASAAMAAGNGGSLRDELLAARAQSQHAKTVDLEIHGYGGRLWGTFRGLDDYAEVRRIVVRNQRIVDPAQQELYTAADTLVAASVDTFAVKDGERQPLGAKFGAPLAAYLGLDGAESDRQAVFLLIESTTNVVTLFAEYDQWMKGAARATDVGLEGESAALS